MKKLRRIENLQVAIFDGYIGAAQHVFKKGELDVGLEAALFEIMDHDVTDEEVVSSTYFGEFNPIEYRSEVTVDEMVTRVNALMTLTREYLNPQYAFAELVETALREGYWKHLEDCFDYRHARVVELGHHVPYVNIGSGFTFILYSHDMSRCLLLVGNESD
jgi:hypothetical protein